MAMGMPPIFSMSSLSNDDALDRVQDLKAELRAIEFWDADYWRKAQPEGYETLANAARQERRAEILSQLPSLKSATGLKE